MFADFPNAQLPRLAPLEASFAENEIEAELKRLFVDLYAAALAAKTFDVNVLGAAHLGTFDLVRKAVNADGLVLLQGDREEAATRYLYRAWNARNAQGRGLHFLRTYLQMLYPNQCEVEQLWQEKAAPYPNSLHATFDQAEADRFFLTSRVRISLYWGAEARAVSKLSDIIQSVIPARLVPEFRYLLKVPPAVAYVGMAVVVGDAVDVLPYEQQDIEWEGTVTFALATMIEEEVDLYPMQVT